MQQLLPTIMASNGVYFTNNCAGIVGCSCYILSSVVLLSANGNFGLCHYCIQGTIWWINCVKWAKTYILSQYCELYFLNKCFISVSAYISSTYCIEKCTSKIICVIKRILNLQSVDWALCCPLTDQNLPKLPSPRERVSGLFFL